MRRIILLVIVATVSVVSMVCWAQPGVAPISGVHRSDYHRSPVDLAISADHRWLFTANQTSNSISVLDLQTGKVVQEVPIGDHPQAVAHSPNGNTLLATSSHSGELTILRWNKDKLKMTGSVYLGFEPRGVAISPDGRLAYVALATGSAIAVVDLGNRMVREKIDVGKWPRYLALSPDGKRLAVGVNGDGSIVVINTTTMKISQRVRLSGINLGQVHFSKDGKSVYVPWVLYHFNPPTRRFIRAGWMLSSRIARVSVNKENSWEALSLDPREKAVADPHGLALSPDEKWMVCAASGSHELLVYKMAGLPVRPFGNDDHLPMELVGNKKRFDRIELGGRPMAVRFSRDGKYVYVANYLRDSVQVVDIAGRRITREIRLGGTGKLQALTLPARRLAQTGSLARQGEAIFYDGTRSLEQWYSCHTCHYEGHTNAIAMDTSNDGGFGNLKMVLSLRNVTRTEPWTWHGWQKDLGKAIYKSMTETMRGKAPTNEEIKALIAFLGSLKTPPNPYRHPNGSLTEAAKRGKKVFHSAKAGCARCHSGKYFTDGRIHDVGLGAPGDVYRGFNPPSLLGVYDRVRYLHDGRVSSLEQLLRGPHNPARIVGMGELTRQEISDLVAWLKAL